MKHFVVLIKKCVILNISFAQVSQGYGRGLRELVKVFLNLITDQSHSCCNVTTYKSQSYHVDNVTMS